MDSSGSIKVFLSEEGPIVIYDKEWKVLSRVARRDESSNDVSVFVRENKAGAVLVYGTSVSAGVTVRAGFLLKGLNNQIELRMPEIVRAARRVGGRIGASANLIDEVIFNLPERRA